MSVEAVEGKIAVPGGEVWYRSMGSGGVPLLLVHGGPGYPSDVLFPAFEPLARERQVIWYDQLGVGRSGPLEDTSLLAVDRFLDELGAVIEGLQLERPHVYGHSWGAMLGLQYAAERTPDWTSLICASGLASVPRYVADVRALMAQLPGDVLDRVHGRELRGETDDPDYMVALGEYMRAHILRNPNPPVSLSDLAGVHWLTFNTMLGFDFSGTLEDWDVSDELERIEVPTLVIAGELDECVPTHMADIASRIPDAVHVTQAGAGHMSYLEAEPVIREYVATIRDFMAGIEARARA